MADLKVKFRIVPELDLSALEDLLEQLRAYTVPPAAAEVIQPVNLPKPKAAPKAKAKKAAPKPAPKPTAKAGRESVCKLCGKSFPIKPTGKAPRYCQPCQDDLKTTTKAA